MPEASRTVQTHKSGAHGVPFPDAQRGSPRMLPHGGEHGWIFIDRGMGASSRRSRTPARAAALCVVLCAAGWVATAAAEPAPVKRVLLLHQELGSRPFRARFNATF